MAFDDKDNSLDFELRELELSVQEKAVRDAFVKEYVQDYSAEGAALRIGFHDAFAMEFAKKFLTEGYTRRAILKVQQEPITEERLTTMRAQVMHKLWAGSNSPFAKPSEQLVAIGLLTKVLALEHAPKVAEGSGPLGGVMVVPPIGETNAWSDAAEISQAKLKAEVRD